MKRYADTMSISMRTADGKTLHEGEIHDVEISEEQGAKVDTIGLGKIQTGDVISMSASFEVKLKSVSGSETQIVMHPHVWGKLGELAQLRREEARARHVRDLRRNAKLTLYGLKMRFAQFMGMPKGALKKIPASRAREMRKEAKAELARIEKQEWQADFEGACLGRDWPRASNIMSKISELPDEIGEEWAGEVFKRLPPEILEESDRVLMATLRGIFGPKNAKA